MPYKDPAAKRAAQKRRYDKRQQWVREQKTPCAECGFTDPRAIDFHHTGEYAKDRNVSRMVTQNASMRQLRDEIAKCVCLCANCHRIKHYMSE